MDYIYIKIIKLKNSIGFEVHQLVNIYYYKMSAYSFFYVMTTKSLKD